MVIKFKIFEDYEVKNLEKDMNQFAKENEAKITKETLVKVYYNRTYIGTGQGAPFHDENTGQNLEGVINIIANSAIIVWDEPIISEQGQQLQKIHDSAMEKLNNMMGEFVGNYLDLMGKYKETRRLLLLQEKQEKEEEEQNNNNKSEYVTKAVNGTVISEQEEQTIDEMIIHWEKVATKVVMDFINYCHPKPYHDLDNFEEMLIALIYPFVNENLKTDTKGMKQISRAWLKYIVHNNIELVKNETFVFTESEYYSAEFKEIMTLNKDRWDDIDKWTKMEDNQQREAKT